MKTMSWVMYLILIRIPRSVIFFITVLWYQRSLGDALYAAKMELYSYPEKGVLMPFICAVALFVVLLNMCMQLVRESRWR